MSEVLQQGLSLFVVGVGAVFAALIVTGLMVALIGRLAREKPPVPAAKAGPLPDVAYSGIDKHVVVLLGAAATVAAKRPVRIRRVRFVSHRHAPAGWAAAGRTDHMEESR
ncbi:MAG: Oxaloacetate decarboxylase, gamma chain [Candidatus Kentron sp. G]|nr:MAG: Oxaloacetate decarboxylase, gamma chain [Candidatus Kentron sp. G]VFM97105.1 MAG: Oxaloacetate decarboxylase, gamma chain [Candidatus Kentron sp. G]VFM97745.1 MAG: Oxaloacetate decarboxylase, gamma chain [Candidatus Kentron sp. G]